MLIIYDDRKLEYDVWTQWIFSENYVGRFHKGIVASSIELNFMLFDISSRLKDCGKKFLVLIVRPISQRKSLGKIYWPSLFYYQFVRISTVH